MNRIVSVLLLVVGFFLFNPSSVEAKNLKKHALVKVAAATVKVATAAPKAAAVGLKDTIGSILFATEAVVDVVHVGTSALNAAASKELKVNPFEYVDKYVGYADTGLEKGYLFFFQAQI